MDTFGLYKYMKLNHQVIGADWNDDEGLWYVKVRDLLSDTVFIDKGEILINGGGVLK